MLYEFGVAMSRSLSRADGILSSRRIHIKQVEPIGNEWTASGVVCRSCQSAFRSQLPQTIHRYQFQTNNGQIRSKFRNSYSGRLPGFSIIPSGWIT